MRTYTFLVEPEEGAGYYVTALPGCFTRGSSVEDCQRRAVEAIEVHIARLQVDGKPIPEESCTAAAGRHCRALSSSSAIMARWSRQGPSNPFAPRRYTNHFGPVSHRTEGWLKILKTFPAICRKSLRGHRATILGGLMRNRRVSSAVMTQPPKRSVQYKPRGSRPAVRPVPANEPAPEPPWTRSSAPGRRFGRFVVSKRVQSPMSGRRPPPAAAGRTARGTDMSSGGRVARL